MNLVSSNINDHFFAKFLRAEAVSCLLHFNYEAFLLQQKVNAGGATRIAWSPFFLPYIIKPDAQKGVEQVLDVVLILDLQG